MNEPAPTEEDVQNIFTQLLTLVAQRPDMLTSMRQYVGQWTRWLRYGLSTIKAFETCVQTLLPSLFRVGCKAPRYAPRAIVYNTNFGSENKHENQ